MVFNYWIVRRGAPASDALVSGHLYAADLDAALRYVRSLPVPGGTAGSELEIILHRGGNEIWRGPYDPARD